MELFYVQIWASCGDRPGQFKQEIYSILIRYLDVDIASDKLLCVFILLLQLSVLSNSSEFKRQTSSEIAI